MSCKILAVVNQKGGVTKTNTCRYLADIYAREGKKVLLIDLDPQGSLTKGFKIDIEELKGANDGNICNIFTNKKMTIVAVDDYDKNIHIVPSNIDLVGIAESAIVGKELKIRKFITDNKIRDYYDVVIIDNNPTFGSLTINAILASDILVVPVGTTKDDQEGLHGFLDKTEETLVAYGHNIQKIVCIPSRHNKKTKVSKVYLKIIKENIEPYIQKNCEVLSASHCLTTQATPESTAFQEASAYGMSAYKYLLEYASKYSNMKKENREELIDRMKKIAKKIIK